MNIQHNKNLLLVHSVIWMTLMLWWGTRDIENSNENYLDPAHNIPVEMLRPGEETHPKLLKPKLRTPAGKRIWPKIGDPDDRILAQLEHVPPGYLSDLAHEKLILVYNGRSRGITWSETQFEDDACAVRNCRITDDVRQYRKKAHAVLVNGAQGVLPSRSREQVWILHLLESPDSVSLHEIPGRGLPMLHNWTSTYRRDSTLPTPHQKFVLYETNPKSTSPRKNYAEDKRGKVAWMVSNCRTRNGRLAYAHALREFIQVDIYGACGEWQCKEYESENCNELLRNNYKFYLSFENSNCEDYITEKFFDNALKNDLIPIAMGARPEDYAAVAPPHSYIHVDDFESPALLAEYLHKLDSNDTLYNEYFLWKDAGEFINSKFWCRMCGLIHSVNGTTSTNRMWYDKVTDWWNGPNVCIHPQKGEKWTSWRNKQTSLHDDYMRHLVDANTEEDHMDDVVID